MEEIFSERGIKDYCFDYDDESDEIKGSCYRNNNPKKLVEGIDLKQLLNGNEVLFEVCKGYDETLLETEDPDVYNEIAYAKFSDLQQRRGAPPSDIAFTDLAKTMENVTDNGFVKKQIITHGVGSVVPENSYVSIHYSLYKEGDPIAFDSTYVRNHPQKLRLDIVETILGLHYAVKSMKKCENSRFFINWEYAFGALGCPDRIQPKCDIIADVTLIDYTEIDIEPDFNGLSEEEVFKHSFQGSINKVKTHHIDGTDHFRRGDVHKAISSFRKSLKILNGLMLADENEEKEMIKQKAKCLVNLAVCYNKVGKYEQACLACQDVLSIQYDNVKAFFQYGKASLALSNFPQAKKWLIKAYKLKPFDPDINAELKKLDEKKTKHELMTKDFCQRAFEKATVSSNNDIKNQNK